MTDWKLFKLFSLTKQLKYNKAVMMFEASFGKTPEYIRSLFTRSTSRYGSQNIIPPRPCQSGIRICPPQKTKTNWEPSAALKDT